MSLILCITKMHRLLRIRIVIKQLLGSSTVHYSHASMNSMADGHRSRKTGGWSMDLRQMPYFPRKWQQDVTNALSSIIMFSIWTICFFALFSALSQVHAPYTLLDSLMGRSLIKLTLTKASFISNPPHCCMLASTHHMPFVLQNEHANLCWHIDAYFVHSQTFWKPRTMPCMNAWSYGATSQNFPTRHCGRF